MLCVILLVFLSHIAAHSITMIDEGSTPSPVCQHQFLKPTLVYSTASCIPLAMCVVALVLARLWCRIYPTRQRCKLAAGVIAAIR